MISLFDRADFSFQINWHSFGQWLLYEGWQTARRPRMTRSTTRSGNRDNPAIPDFEPGLSSDVLYVTNGETTDFAHTPSAARWLDAGARRGRRRRRVRVPRRRGAGAGGVRARAAVRARRGQVRGDPANPVSHLGIETKPFYLKSDDTYKYGLPLANFTFDYSYGDPQEVRVIAQRALGDVTPKYSINGDDPISGTTEEWTGGDRYGGRPACTTGS